MDLPTNFVKMDRPNMVHLIIQGPKGPPNLKKIYSLKFSEKMSTSQGKLSS